jgi:hypothetical protein
VKFRVSLGNALENLEVDEFLDAYDLLKLSKEDINHINTSIMSNEFEAVIKSSQ